jgi:hypothetical protein
VWHYAAGAAGTEAVAVAATVAAGGVLVDAAAGAVLALSVLDGAAPPPLKSVAYQPEPLSWKPAAVSCFLNVGWAQDGQTSNTGSDIFCNTSLTNPQDSHL